MLPPSFVQRLLTFITITSLHQNTALAQYFQRYQYVNYTLPNNAGFEDQFWWQPTIGSPPQLVRMMAPDAVFLVYNCYYMREICTNAQNWFNGARGSTVGQANAGFSFDFNGRGGRGGQRGDMSCPSNWKTTHNCPEPNQQKPMRHDKEWYFSDLEYSTGSLLLKHLRDAQGNIVEASDIQYTCDEFPPASFVEGGSGVPFNPPATHGFPSGDAETRCAAWRCPNRGVTSKAEQNWQGWIHNKLRWDINRRIKAQHRANNQRHVGWDNKADVAFFGFRMENVNNGVAAKVLTWEASSNSYARTTIEKQAKRSESEEKRQYNGDYWQWINTVTLEELQATGNITESRVLAEDDQQDFGSMPNLETSMTGSWFADPALGTKKRSQRWVDDGQSAESKREHEQHGRDGQATPLLKRATASDVSSARKLVEEALEKSAMLNQARLERPFRNPYSHKPQTEGKQSDSKLADEEKGHNVPHLLKVTDELAAAAALVSEAEAVGAPRNHSRNAASRETFWMENIKRQGTVPWGNDTDYKVFRNVLDYGAVGDGSTDDTEAIKRALNDGGRCGENCYGSTVKNAIVYFPSGTYLVSSTIPLPFSTQVIGDANNWPTIVASRCFLGLGVLSTNEYTGNGVGPDGKDQQSFITTGNFYRQIRNLRIDITETPSDQRVAGIHYQVAQATSLQHIELIAANGTNQMGIFAENGSGGVISDITFKGGAFGIYGGTQQFTAQRLEFVGCDVGVQIIWDWGWVWKSVSMSDVGIGFRLIRENVTEDGHVGSTSIIDSTFKNTHTGILTTPPKQNTGAGSTGITLDNVEFENVEKPVADESGATLLDKARKIDHWVVGPVYSPDREFSLGNGSTRAYPRQEGLVDSRGAFFERAKPQYEAEDVTNFVHVKDFGARGDGQTDDTKAFQSALWASQGKILFVDAGSYILTGTLTVPIGSRLVGEAWSQLVATGAYFQDEKNPKVLIQVGEEGNVGSIEMQDLLFTSRGRTSGLILVKWNVKAKAPGAAGMWDCHVRLGGALGTDLTAANCPSGTNAVSGDCKVASLMMHVTSKASGYFENVWLWAADHMIDDDDLGNANNTMAGVSVYAARGLLIESVEPTWLYGTSCEHAIFYQYNFHQARNVFAGMVQTESPYFLPHPGVPSPFENAIGAVSGDDFYNSTKSEWVQGLEPSWAIIMRESADVSIVGAGLYSWFWGDSQACVDKQSCQAALVLLEDNYSNVRIQNMVTIGSTNMIVQDGEMVSAKDNLHVQTHPRWSYISVFNVGDPANDVMYLDSNFWAMDKPSFSCSPPCLIQLPPWTKATRTVNYPRITITDGTWKTTITEPPIAISKWAFEVMTITRPNCQKCERDDIINSLLPILANTTGWPAATFTNSDGIAETTAPEEEFPGVPTMIGPITADPADPWPTEPVNIDLGDTDPLVKRCHYLDPFCASNPWGNIIPAPIPDDEEETDEEEPQVADDQIEMCPFDASTTSSAVEEPTETAEPEPEPPEPSPYEHGDPMLNQVKCYNSGRTEDHSRADNGIESYCNSLLGAVGDGGIASENFFHERPYEFPVKNMRSPTEFIISLKVEEGCEWVSDMDECTRYLLAPIDACNCGGKNGKQGGTVANNCLTWRIDPNKK